MAETRKELTGEMLYHLCVLRLSWAILTHSSLPSLDECARKSRHSLLRVRMPLPERPPMLGVVLGAGDTAVNDTGRASSETPGTGRSTRIRVNK